MKMKSSGFIFLLTLIQCWSCLFLPYFRSFQYPDHLSLIQVFKLEHAFGFTPTFT